MAQQYNHFQYCEALIAKLKVFSNHPADAFFKSPNSDTLLSISQRLSNIGHPVLVAIDGKDSDFEDNEAEQFLKHPQYFMMILLPASGDNSESILKAQEDAEANLTQIMLKMLEQHDRIQEGLHGLEKSSFSIGSIGPIGDGLYGAVMGFSMKHGINTNIDKSFWV